MKASATKKFLEAVKAAGIKNFEFYTSPQTHLYNDGRSVVIFDEKEELVINFRRKISGSIDPYDANIRVYCADIADVHEVRTGGTLDQIKKFIESYGLELDDEQKMKILKINAGNYDIKPITKDYYVFTEKTEEEIEQMTPQQKAEYEELLRANSGLGQGAAAQITV